jgi:hypothetical protein
MPSLTTGVKWEPRTENALIILQNAHDAVLFSHGWDFEVWARTLKTFIQAQSKVRIEAIQQIPGMKGAL